MYTHFVIKQQIQANNAVNHHNFYFIFSNKSRIKGSQGSPPLMAKRKYISEINLRK